MANELSKELKASLPAFAKEDAGLGLDGVERFIRPQVLKIIQRQSTGDYANYDAGSLLLVPEMTVFKGKGEVFHFIPVLYFVEYLKTNPLGVDPFILERSLDPQSEIAKRALNPDLRIEVSDAGNITYQEVLNFIVMPYPETDPFFGSPIVMSFRRGSHRDGTKLMSLLNRRRKAHGAPIFACVFQAETKIRSSKLGEYYVIDVNNPTEQDPYIQDEALYAQLKDLHLKLKERQGEIVVDHSEEVQEPASEF